MQQDQKQTRSISLSVADEARCARVFHALASKDRLRILQAVETGGMNVLKIAEKCQLPVSTTAAHIRLLEDTGLLISESVAGKHGAMKICTGLVDHIDVELRTFKDAMSEVSVVRIDMPLGAFSRVIDLKPTCGIVTAKTNVGAYDLPRSFYLPNRFDAQLLWFKEGMIEYLFGLPVMGNEDIAFLELSFEACSEAPMYRNTWESDISLFMNDRRIGVWTSPGDLGGRRGLLNPDWWPMYNTQYGYLVTWRVDKTGSYLDKTRVSDITIDDLHLAKHDALAVRLGIERDAEHIGGMNLFGDAFGDHPQALVLKIGVY